VSAKGYFTSIHNTGFHNLYVLHPFGLQVVAVSCVETVPVTIFSMNEHMKRAQCSIKHVSHNRRINGVVLSNGHRTWYDISHTDGWGGDMEHCAIQWKGSGNKKKFTYSHN